MWNGLGYAATAEVLGIPVGTVRSRLSPRPRTAAQTRRSRARPRPQQES
ncbi:sigma factor-like helix-turn-helix DNA-binding protein [Streptomyces sp. NBC_01142]|nr:sigma factor-like helix-turn-helix DNA-binding protein [Streptomyces sp. NBC_01142]